jgi:hypothetical protein
MAACVLFCAMAVLIYGDIRTRLADRAQQQQREHQQAKQPLPETNPAGEAAAQIQALVGSLQQDIRELRQSNAVLLGKLLQQENASERGEAQARPNKAPLRTKPELLAPVRQSPQSIHVYEIVGEMGSWRRCRTDVGDILIAKFPSHVAQYWDEVNKLKAQIADFSARAEAADQNARRVSAVTPVAAGGDPYYVDSAMRQRAQANLMLEDVRDAKANLAKMRAALSSWQSVERERTTILAVRSGRQYAGMDVWNYVGMASGAL